MKLGRLHLLGPAAVALGLATGLLGGIPHASARLVLTGWDPVVQVDKFKANITVNAADLGQVGAIAYVVHIPVGTDKTKVKFTKPIAPVAETLAFAYDQQGSQVVVEATTTAIAGGSTPVSVIVSQGGSILANVAGETGATVMTPPMPLN